VNYVGRELTPWTLRKEDQGAVSPNIWLQHGNRGKGPMTLEDRVQAQY